MLISKAIAKAYGISEDFAILLAATMHRWDPTDDELLECDYTHDLPKGIAEFVVTAVARRAINDGVLLQEVVDRILKLDVFPTEYEIAGINDLAKIQDFKHWTPKQLRKYFQEAGKRGFQILKHAAIYQKKILENEYGGILPRKLPEIIEQVNLVNQKAGK